MSNENLNLITVIKYLQDQYTLNERNRLNYELLLRSKQLQREKGTSVDNINQTLKQIHIDNNKFNEQSEVDNIIQEAKFKLSTAMKDLDLILAEQEFNNDLTYKRKKQLLTIRMRFMMGKHQFYLSICIARTYPMSIK